MTAQLIGQFEPGSDAWNEARRRRLGGSEVAAVLGLSPYESPYSLWHKKAGNLSPNASNRFTEWGNRLEPVVATKFAESTGCQLERSPGTFVDSDRPWQSASPDAFIGDRDAILEIKTSQRADDWGQPGTAEIPVHYRCQVLWYLDVFGLERAHVAVLIGGADYREYLIEVDDEARADQLLMREAGAAFIASLDAGTPPDIDDNYATLQAVRALHPDIVSGNVEVPSALADAYVDAVVSYREAKSTKDELTSLVLDALGDLKSAVVDGRRFAYRTSRRNPDGTPGTPYLATDWRYVEQSSPAPRMTEGAA